MGWSSDQSSVELSALETSALSPRDVFYPSIEVPFHFPQTDSSSVFFFSKSLLCFWISGFSFRAENWPKPY